MDSNSGYKNRALASLEGNWGDAALATLIFGLFYYIPAIAMELFIENLSNIWVLAMLPMAWGFTIIFLSLTRGNKIVHARLFDGYSDFSRIFITKVLQNCYTALWTLLLIVPGIIKYYSYAMTDYVLKDDPTISNNAAIEESMRLMDGHKMDLFLLQLSFIGWAILSCLTLGIGFFFLLPYVETATAHFYEDLKAESPYE